MVFTPDGGSPYRLDLRVLVPRDLAKPDPIIVVENPEVGSRPRRLVLNDATIADPACDLNPEPGPALQARHDEERDAPSFSGSAAT